MVEVQHLIPAAATAVHGGVVSKRLVLGFLAERLAGCHGLDTATVLNSLLQREAEGSTAFGGGVAIPHGRITTLSDVHGAFVRLIHPIDWEAPDGQPVDLVVALVGPDGTALLKSLALASRILRNRHLRAKLRGAGDGDSLWALLASEEVA